MNYRNLLHRQTGVFGSLLRIGALLILITMAAGLILSSCTPKKKVRFAEPQIPYPDQKMAVYLQAQVDSSRQLWFLDPKAIASYYCNDQLQRDGGGNVNTKDITIVNQGVYHAVVEVKLPKKTYVLTLERPFKEKRENSIWQVIKLEKK